MGEQGFRVIVRGQFDALTAGDRLALIAAVDEHDLFHARFTEAGTLTYDRSLVAFSYRCLVPVQPGADAVDPSVALDRAASLGQEKAEVALRALGYGYRALRAEATDLSAIRVRRRS
jgi:Family of unknown function (DUF6204)